MSTPNDPVTNRGEIVPGFFDKLTRFSYSDFFRNEEEIDGVRVQIPAYRFAKKDEYFSTLFRGASDVLKAAYEDGGAYRYTTLADAIFRRAVLGGTPEEQNQNHEWANIFPEIESIISSKGEEVRAAFNTLFDICKSYEKKVNETPSRPHQPKEISRDVHGLNEEEAQHLDNAMHTIWEAFPSLDPRIIEGFEIVFNSSPVVAQALPRYHMGGITNGNSLIETALKKDISLAEARVEEHHYYLNEKANPVIARKFAENLELFEPFAQQIAVASLARFLRINLTTDSRGSFIDTVDMVESNALAQLILQELTRDPSQMAKHVKLIKSGKHSPLDGKRSWLCNDERRKEVLRSLSHTEDYLELCLDVHDGIWFDRTREKLVVLIEEADKVASDLDQDFKRLTAG